MLFLCLKNAKIASRICVSKGILFETHILEIKKVKDGILEGIKQ